MTDEQIIKVLECCREPMNRGCHDCPLEKSGCAGFDNEGEALDLIHRQKAEIERLKESYAAYEETTGLKWARSEAITEYHEEVKKRCIEGGIYPVLVERVMLNLKKEMVGEQQ